MRRFVLFAAVALLAALVIWLVPLPFVRFWAGFGLLWVIPGLAWMPLLSRAQVFSNAEKLVVALGLSFVITPFIVLLAAFLPGELTRETLIVSMLPVIVLPPAILASLQWRRGTVQESPGSVNFQKEVSRAWWKTEWFWVLLIIAFAAVMRLVNLGYAEFQGDEAAVLVRAAKILTGEDAVLFQHKKGPLELLLVMAGWQLTGITNEWMSRLPFAWASIVGIAGIFLYGRRISTLLAAVAAGGLLAIEGYLVGFGRIVQYQSLVFLLSTLALLCLLIYSQRRKGFLVILAAIFFAVGSWAHYDAILFLPAGLLIIALSLKTDWHQWQQMLPVIAAAGILGLFLVALFYVPFSQSSQAEGTLFYVSGRIGSEQAFYNHLHSTMNRAFVYDSVYFLALVLGTSALQFLFTWRRWGIGAAVLALILLLALTTTLLYPDLWQLGDRTYAWVVMAILLAGALFAPGQNPGTRAIWLWLGVPAMFYLYFVAVPLTHVYTAVPAAALLAALGIYNFVQRLDERSHLASRAAAAIAISLFILSISYTIIVFLNHAPEYLRQYPQSKLTLYWTPFGEELPQEGLFGFPYRAGWKMVGYLLDSGEITGSYDSNEERDVTDYYTRQALRFDCATPDTYVVAENVQDEVGVRFDQIEADFRPSAIVEVGGRPKTTIFQQNVGTDPLVFAVEDFEYLYDSGTTPDVVADASPAMSGERPAGFFPLDAQIGGFATLTGYQVDTRYARPGGYIELLLLWQALGPAAIDYQVFTHLYDGQEMRGQLDGQPICNSAPTSSWQAGTFIVDPYRIPIDPEAKVGTVPLTVGMYDLTTLQRVPVTMPGDSAVVDAIYITDVEIHESE